MKEQYQSRRQSPRVEIQAQVEFFIDEYTSATEYQGINIYRIEQAPDKSLPTFVSVSCYSYQIAHELTAQGFSDCFNFNQSIKKIPTLFEQFEARERAIELG